MTTHNCSKTRLINELLKKHIDLTKVVEKIFELIVLNEYGTYFTDVLAVFIKRYYSCPELIEDLKQFRHAGYTVAHRRYYKARGRKMLAQKRNRVSAETNKRFTEVMKELHTYRLLYGRDYLFPESYLRLLVPEG